MVCKYILQIETIIKHQKRIDNHAACALTSDCYGIFGRRAEAKVFDGAARRFEDTEIIRPEEIKAAPEDVRKYISESIERILKEPIIEEAIYAVLPGGEVADENVGIVLERMKTIIS